MATPRQHTSRAGAWLRRAWAWIRHAAAWPFVRERGRIALVLFVLCLVFLYVGRKLVIVQLRPDEARVYSITTNGYVRTLPGLRGPIRDRNGAPLSVTVPRWKLSLDAVALDEVWERKKTNVLVHVYTNLLSFGLCPPETLRETFNGALESRRPRNKPLGITEDREVIRAIARDRLLRACVSREDLTRREYFGGREFAHLLGVVNGRGEAQSGLERRFDEELRGCDGRIQSARRANGEELRGRRFERTDPVDGCAVVLTIDQTLQRIVSEAMDDAMDQFDPDAAWAIVEDVATGEILAMASRPDFEPEEYFRLAAPDAKPEEARRLWNSAVFQAFEPGSVMKPFVTAAALQEGLVATNSILDVSDTLYCGRRLNDHRGMADRITVTELIKFSSNRGASRLAMMLGKARTEKWLRAFGFGARTGIQLREEGTGLLVPSRKWSDLQGIRVAIGQGVAVTGIQLVNAYACIANGGRLLKPSIVKEIVSPTGEAVWTHETEEIGRPIGERTARDMAFMLAQVTKEGGTARRGAVAGYEVAGKTGTAQLVENGRYLDREYCASFCGFFPARDPQLAILVTVKRPRKTERNPLRLHTGGSVSAPIFAKIAAAAADYLLIPTDEEAAAPPPPEASEPDEPDDVVPFEDLTPDEEA